MPAPTRTTARLAAVLAATLLLAAACGTDDNTTTGGSAGPAGAPDVQCASGTVSGAGATFVQTIVQQWIKDYAAACPQAVVNYQPVGSGAGIQQLTAGTVDFAGSDVPMKPDEEAAAVAARGPVVHIPWSAGAVAVEYNLDGVTDLKLTPEALAGIFAGTVTRWDDPAIAAANRGTRLPSAGIQVVHRSDGSGTTAAFTSYLAAAAPGVWKVGAGKDVAWPTGQGAKGSDGVTAAVKQTAGSIGYAEVSFAKGASLGVARIGNSSGAFVAPEAAAVSAALASAEIPDDLKLVPDYQPAEAAAYPISTPTFVIVPTDARDPARTALVRSFVLYALGPGQDSAERLFYAPLPAGVVTRAAAAAMLIGG